MRPSTWITVAKCACVYVGLLGLSPASLGARVRAQEKAAQPAQAQPAKPEAGKAKATQTAPAANSGAAQATSAANSGAAPAEKAKAGKAAKTAKASKAKAAEPAAAPVASPAKTVEPPAPVQVAQAPLRLKSSEPLPPSAAGSAPNCSLLEPEQPRGGRLDVVGERIGPAPVVRIAGKPARMLERRADRISVQIPADSDGGAITLQNDGKALACGNLVIIGKNR